MVLKRTGSWFERSHFFQNVRMVYAALGGKGGDHHHDVDDDIHDAQEHRLSLKYRHGHQQHRRAVLLMTMPILKRQSMLLCIMNIIMRVIVKMMLIINIIINIMMMITTFVPQRRVDHPNILKK